METLKLIQMNEVKAEEVKWLWYPYILYGKITLMQGDSGNGKTTMILAIVAAVTMGAFERWTEQATPSVSKQ